MPDELSRTLKAKAAMNGTSLSDYLLAELHQIAARPSRAELFARIKSRGIASLPPAADVLAAERENHLSHKLQELNCDADN